ncbi:APC family permease [Streptomyces sp. 205]|uniref:APC family permease n=2 Tax=Streptomyces coffeae TaxID=621382 RepID=A0ABS1N6Q3_9ACTN|nr:APC family permease [Streptomyces coffeae]MBL1095733.1 APC family permease [Streptomyces coffeae]
MAVAGTAPAYSLAATTTALIATAGSAGPAALLWCAIPMLGIAFAFSYLGRVDVNAGASYSWVGRTLHPALGFLSGWALVVSATVFMVAGSLPAGTATLSLFAPDLADSTPLATAVGAGWFLLMAGLVVMGARITAHAQWIMTGVELAILLFVGVVALVRGGAGRAFDWSWLGLGHFDGAQGFAAAALLAAFYFWGWDVTANLSEETRNSRRTSGLGGLLGVVMAFLIFEMITIAVNTVLTARQIDHGDTQILTLLGDAVLPGWGGKAMILAVILSTVATLETTLIQVTRSLFAMGRDNTLPAALGRSHPTRRTPWVATATVVVVALALFIGSNALGSVGTIMSSALEAMGLQICVYYALAGFAVVVAYRKLLLRSFGTFFFVGVWPLAGAVFMSWVFWKSLPTLDTTTLAVGLGALGLGLLPMAYYWMSGTPFYRRGPRLDARVAQEMDDKFGTGLETAHTGPRGGGMLTDL